MFYIRETPWHGLGVKVEEALSSRKALELGGLDLSVIQKGTQYIEDTDNNYAQSAKNLSTHSTGKTNNSNDKSNDITNNVYPSQVTIKIPKVQQTTLVSIMNERKLLLADIRIIMN